METKIQFVPISEEFAQLMGRQDKGTRIFRQEGNHNQMRLWFDSLCKNIGPCVSPGGAAVYAGVSRAGVYKRMQSGGISAFCFHIIGKKKTLFGGEKKLKEFPVVYIPVSECKAWGEELERRVKRIKAIKKITDDDKAAFEEADPGIDDPSPDFVHYDPNDKKAKVPAWSGISPEQEMANPDLPNIEEEEAEPEEKDDDQREG